MKLLMQPLASINVRTEALLLTKVEVWWYLVVQLGSNLSANFDQVTPLSLSTTDTPLSPIPARVLEQKQDIDPTLRSLSLGLFLNIKDLHPLGSSIGRSCLKGCFNYCFDRFCAYFKYI